MVMFLTILLGPLASAQERGGAEDSTPLAIPAEAASPGAAGTRERPPLVTVRVTGAGAEASERAREYRDRYLAVRTGAEVWRGAPLTVTTGWGWGPLYSRPTLSMWPMMPRVVERVGVVQGREWLDTPDVLGALGDEGGRRDLQRRIGNHRSAAAFLQGVAVVGVGGIVTGLVGADRARTSTALRRWHAVSGTGIALAVGGFMTSAIPGRRADYLQHDVRSVMSVEELQERSQQHNRELAEELGINPGRAADLEQ